MIVVHEVDRDAPAARVTIGRRLDDVPERRGPGRALATARRVIANERRPGAVASGGWRGYGGSNPPRSWPGRLRWPPATPPVPLGRRDPADREILLLADGKG